MIVYVVCAEVPYDSYHSLVLVTLDEKEADKELESQNSKHEPGCTTQRKTDSDWDECFCRKYHKHSVPLKGLMPRIRRIMDDLSDFNRIQDFPADDLTNWPERGTV